MNGEIFIAIISNAILLMSLAVLYSVFPSKMKLSYFLRKTIMGISVGIIGLLVMYNHVAIENGIIFDGRSIVMILSGMFFGLIPTIIGAIPLIIYRISVGGAGVIPGIIWIVIPAIIGLIWRKARLKTENNDMGKIKFYELYLLILATQSLMVIILFLFPNKVPVGAINTVAAPLILFYPLSGFLVSVFMLRIRQSYFQSINIMQKEKEYNQLFNNNAVYTLIVDPVTMKIENVNETALKRYGYSFEEFTKLTALDINLKSKKEIRSLMQKILKGEIDYFTTKHVTKNNDVFDVEVRVVPIILDNKKFLYANVTDITSKLEKERQLQDVNVRLKATLHSISDGVIVTDEYGHIQIVNEVATRFVDAVPNHSNNIFKVVNGFTRTKANDFEKAFKSVISTKKPFNQKEPTRIMDSNDNEMFLNFSISPIQYDDGMIQGCILVFKNITEEFKSQNEVQYVSQHDFLTGLYNRYFIEVEMKRLDTKRQLPITIIIGDINGLKLTNDTFGHNEGDNLIIEIANILKQATRSEDIISRWGGDEFLILLPQTSKENAEKVRQRITDLQLKSRLEVVTPSISVGIATKTESTQNLNTLLIEAEKEMYFNKQEDGIKFRENLLINLSKKMDKVHPELLSHTTNVALIIADFAKHMGYTKEETSLLINLATYHDIGWVGVDSSVQLTSDPITEEDKFKIRNHTEIGFRIMKAIPKFVHLADFIGNHHEHWDGSGYPNGIKGKSISIQNRILLIIDAYEVMTSDKKYSENKTKQQAFATLRKYAGLKYDPELVEKFIEMKEKE